MTTPPPRTKRMYDRCEVCARIIEHRPDPRRRRCADHLAQRELFPRSAARRPRSWQSSPGSRGRELDTIACPQCVGAHPVEDWSLLDPCCELCVGCGRITVESPASGGERR